MFVRPAITLAFPDIHMQEVRMGIIPVLLPVAGSWHDVAAATPSIKLKETAPELDITCTHLVTDGNSIFVSLYDVLDTA